MKVEEALILSWVKPYPLNPTGLVKHEFQSYFMVLNGTLSWGLLGPETHGATVDKSNSKTAPEKLGS